MIDQFTRFWSPVLYLFQLFGYATYISRPSTNNCLHIRRLAIAAIITAIVLLFGIYMLRTQISFHGDLQLNDLTDRSVFITVIVAHVTSLVEALVVYHKGTTHFQQMYEIIKETSCAARFVETVRRGVCTTFRRKNSLQLATVAVVMCVGITVTGFNTWLYFRWILISEIAICVRLMEVSMQVEMLAELIGNLERTIVCEIACVDAERVVDTRFRCARLQKISGIYDSIFRLSETIGTMYEWSVFAILVYVINGMINTTFWLCYCIANSVVM